MKKEIIDNEKIKTYADYDMCDFEVNTREELEEKLNESEESIKKYGTYTTEEVFAEVEEVLKK
jgi:hypothetical protein